MATATARGLSWLPRMIDQGIPADSEISEHIGSKECLDLDDHHGAALPHWLVPVVITVVGGAIGYGAIMASVQGTNEAQERHLTAIDTQVGHITDSIETLRDRASQRDADIAVIKFRLGSIDEGITDIKHTLSGRAASEKTR